MSSYVELLQRPCGPAEAHLYLMDNHGLVRKVHDGFGNCECEGAQACAIATHEDEGLHGCRSAVKTRRAEL